MVLSGSLQSKKLTMTFSTPICSNPTIYTDSRAGQDQRLAFPLVEKPFDPTDCIGMRDIRKRVDECWVFG